MEETRNASMHTISIKCSFKTWLLATKSKESMLQWAASLKVAAPSDASAKPAIDAVLAQGWCDLPRDTPEGDGNMLDNTLCLWGSAHPHASHSGKNYPIQIAGGKNMGFKHGNLHEFRDDKKVPLANLFVTMLNALDVPIEKFADSTGNMSQLLRA